MKILTWPFLAASFLLGVAGCENEIGDPPPRYYEQHQFSETDYLHGVYFWLTDTTRAGDGRIVADFRDNYRYFLCRGVHRAVSVNQQVQEIELYVSINGLLPDGSEVNGRAVNLERIQDLREPSDAVFYAGGPEHVMSNWKRLELLDYEIDRQLGTVRLNSALEDGQALAAAFRLGGTPDDRRTGQTFGTLPATEDSCALVLLRSKLPTVTDATWPLMFRHVYFVGADALDKHNFQLRILHRGSTAHSEPGPPRTDLSYLTCFSFDLHGEGGVGLPDGQVDDLSSLIRWDRGELQFLDITPFDPSGYVQGEEILRPELPPPTAYDTVGYRLPYLYLETRAQLAMRNTFWRFEVAIDTTH